MQTQTVVNINLVGQRCPGLTIKFAKFMRGLKPDTLLIATADDEESLIDIPASVVSAKNDLIGIMRKGSIIEFSVQIRQ